MTRDLRDALEHATATMLPSADLVARAQAAGRRRLLIHRLGTAAAAVTAATVLAVGVTSVGPQWWQSTPESRPAATATQPVDAETAAATASASSGARERLAAVLAEAQAGGAGARQVAVLEAAVQGGSIEYEDVVPLIGDTFACLTDAGIGYTQNPPTEWVPGWKVASYAFDAEAPGLTEDQVKERADACMTEHSKYAEFALQDPLVHQEVRDAYLRAQLPVVLACLRDNGVVVADNATLDQVRRAALDLLNATADSTQPVTCYSDLATTP